MTRPSSQTSTVRAVMFRCTQPWPCSTRSAVSTSEATSAARYGVSGSLGEQRRQRPRGHHLTHYPQRPALGEHVEDLVEPRVVGNLGRGLRGLDRPPHRRFGGPPRGPPRPAAALRRPGPRTRRAARPRRAPPPRRSRATAPAGPGLPARCRCRRPGSRRVRTRPTAAAADGSGRRVPVPHSRPRCLPRPPGWSIPFAMRPVVAADVAAYGPQPLTIRAGGNPQRGDARSQESRAPQDFGSNDFVSVCHVFLRSSVSHFEPFAVYMSPYPRPSLTTNPRSIDRYCVPLST